MIKFDNAIEEHKYKYYNGFYDSVIDVIQKHIDKLSELEYKWDDQCKPKFTVSVLQEPECDYIILTIDHRSVQFSEKIFPRINMRFGYEDIYEMMTSLFKQTM